ncbi:MAG: magnesium transporter CorA family protein [Streptococcaceae bacterium]|jgi:magnesium transporter|nr:magnesium transporter CorA family protein [Streptococcaceae bacterium]
MVIRFFSSTGATIKENQTAGHGTWIMMTSPTIEESRTIAEQYDIEYDDLRSALDEEERSRLQIEEHYSLILVDIPVIEKRNNKDWYITLPLGIIITDEVIITICIQENSILQDFASGIVKNFFTYMKTRFIFQILYKNASLYLRYLRVINRKSDKVEAELHRATRNEELIELLEMEKTLVYFTTSLKSNEIVLEKLLKSRAIKKYPEDTDLLEDAIVENKQAIEMANIYTNILNGMLDTFASIISNNQNVIMKFLAIATIVMSIPTMIFSAYGMNLKDNNLPLANTTHAFWIILVLSTVLSIATILYFIKKRFF